MAIVVKEPTVADRQTAGQPVPNSSDSGVTPSAQIREGTVSPRVAAVNQRLALADREADVAADVAFVSAVVPIDRQLPEQADVAADDTARFTSAELSSAPTAGVSVDRQLPEQADVASADVASSSAKVPVERRLPEVSSAPNDASAPGRVKPAPTAENLEGDSWRQAHDKAVRLESDQFKQSDVPGRKP